MIDSQKINIYICDETQLNNLINNNKISFKFSVKYKNKRLYINSKLLESLLESKPIRDFITKQCSFTIRDNKTKIKNYINSRFVNDDINVNIKLVGLFFYINITTGRNATEEKILECIRRKVKNKKDIYKVLYGEE